MAGIVNGALEAIVIQFEESSPEQQTPDPSRRSG
jgi:hypothetical protein